MMKRTECFIPLILSLFLFPFIFFYLCPFNTTGSMPYGFYLRLPDWKISEGDLVILENPLPVGSYGVNAEKGLLKRVTEITPDGRYVVRGESKASYDSRYYGPVDRSLIYARVIPVFTSHDLSSFVPKALYACLVGNENQKKN